LNITEVNVKLLKGRSDRLRAFCSITVDDEFVVHDLRVIEGSKALFVAMPSRKLSDNCPRCGGKNHLRAKFCSECGAKLDEGRSAPSRGRDKLHVDVAHPIDPACREMIQSTVLAAYEDEVKRSEEGLDPSRAYKREEPEELEDGVEETVSDVAEDKLPLEGEQRERDEEEGEQREREQRERDQEEREQKEREQREREQQEEREQREREQREREREERKQEEREQREREQQEEREQREREQQEEREQRERELPRSQDERAPRAGEERQRRPKAGGFGDGIL